MDEQQQPGTADWADPASVGSALGHGNARHVCLVSGEHGGKGTSSITPTLLTWPGSVVCVDPKGENATVTAERRGKGSATVEGMGQAVHVLDPFHVATVDESDRVRFNPLDALDPNSDNVIGEAGRIVASIQYKRCPLATN